MTISELRKRLGLTQEELARLLGVAQSTVASWESGARIPRFPMVRNIAITLGVSVDELDFPHLSDSRSA